MISACKAPATPALFAVIMGLLLVFSACERKALAPPADDPPAPQTASAPDQPAEREFLRYFATLSTGKVRLTTQRLEAAAKRLNVVMNVVESDKSVSTQWQLLVPQENYLDFIEELTRLASLTLHSERYDAPRPSNAPIEFFITIQQKEAVDIETKPDESSETSPK